MHRRSMAFVSLLMFQLAFIAGGCNDSGGTNGAKDSQNHPSKGVAVVDLDEVAKQLGIDVELVKQINAGQASLNQQLQSLQTTLREKYEQKERVFQSQVAVNPSRTESPVKNQELVQLERELNLQLNKARQTAQQKLNVYRQQLIQQFRNEVVPIAREIAAQRGLGVVITKNDSVLLAYDEAHDITVALIARLRSERSSLQEQQSSTAGRPAPSDSSRR